MFSLLKHTNKITLSNQQKIRCFNVIIKHYKSTRRYKLLLIWSIHLQEIAFLNIFISLPDLQFDLYKFFLSVLVTSYVFHVHVKRQQLPHIHIHFILYSISIDNLLKKEHR